MNAAFDLLPLLLLAALPMLFIVQFFGSHSRSAAWATPAKAMPAPFLARPLANNVTDIDTARTARHAGNIPLAA